MSGIEASSSIAFAKVGVSDFELAEVGGRARKHRCAHVGEPRLDLRVGESSIDLLVELVDDLGGCVLGRAKAEKGARLETWCTAISSHFAMSSADKTPSSGKKSRKSPRRSGNCQLHDPARLSTQRQLVSHLATASHALVSMS
jgi:hypothetical protein